MLKEMKVKNESMKVYEVEGKRFIIISKLAEALDANKADVYNAAARMGKDAVERYIRVLTLSDMSLSRPTAKCIDIEGIDYLLRKIERKADPQKLEAVKSFLNIYTDLKSKEEPKSNIVEFNPTIAIENNSNVETQTETQEQDENTIISLENNVDVSNNESTGDAEDIIDGIITIIEENKNLKEKVTSLEYEVKSLQEEISKFNGNPLEMEFLRKENEELKIKLKESEDKSSILLDKANLIKNYIQNNR